MLLKAMEQLPENVTLTVIGRGVLEEELKQQCLEKGMENRVRFLGEVSDETLRQCYQEADVFVLPSTERSEAFGLVQLEAMAYGLPVINTNLKSGVPEVSVHGQTGLTVEPEDVQGLAEAVKWMQEHREERLKMAENARKRVEENYTEKVMLEKLMEVYQDLLKADE